MGPKLMLNTPYMVSLRILAPQILLTPSETGSLLRMAQVWPRRIKTSQNHPKWAKSFCDQTLKQRFHPLSVASGAQFCAKFSAICSALGVNRPELKIGHVHTVGFKSRFQWFSPLRTAKCVETTIQGFNQPIYQIVGH